MLTDIFAWLLGDERHKVWVTFANIKGLKPLGAAGTPNENPAVRETRLGMRASQAG